MKFVSLTMGVLAATSLAVTGELRPDTYVSFKATIDESSFLTPGYNVGSVITGWYSYDPATLPFDVGANYAMYHLPGMKLSFGPATYEATGGGRLNVVHFLPEVTPNAVDLYDLLGFTLAGPFVEGYSPAYSEVSLTDTDNSVYASIWPPPLDLPEPELFEGKELRIGFLQRPSLTSRIIHAQIDFINASPNEPDFEPPTILSLSASPNILWPPNGRMATVQVEVIAEDNVGVTSSSIVEVTSNEPLCGARLVKTAPDWEVLTDLSLKLRAERCGAGSGRVYTIVVQCADAAGNTALSQVDVTIPHSPGARK